ncbi:hypothetical protein SNEBB_002421 [Seison nebaliae]|nr:hypothetical protein SNEBB_002421 [Seison nebaliae]
MFHKEIFFLFSFLLTLIHSYTDDEAHRIDCVPEALALGDSSQTRKYCTERGCKWKPSDDHRVPWCYYGEDETDVQDQYVLNNKQDDEVDYVLSNTMHKWPRPVEKVNVKFTYYKDILRAKFTDKKQERYEVPIELFPHEQPSTNGQSYTVETSKTGGNHFLLKVARSTSGDVIFDSSSSGLIYTDQFIQFGTKLPKNGFVYGLGENNHEQLVRDINFRKWGVFGLDQGPGWEANRNLYGAHPFFMVIEETGNAYGVFILNSNAFDYELVPAPALTFRFVGGIIDLFIFTGPKPEDVIKQYQQVIGRPTLIPYWSLGFQLCRWGYNTLENMERIVNETLDSGIPYDVQYVDIDHMDTRKDFTIDPINWRGLNDFVKRIHNLGMRFISILDPALVAEEPNYLPFQRGLAKDVYMKWPKGTTPNGIPIEEQTGIMLGAVWPEKRVAFPNFFKNETKEWWIDELQRWHRELEWDGVWIDMNEPANFGTNEQKPWNWPDNKADWSLKCFKNDLDDPPYVPMAAHAFRNRLSYKTLCMNGQLPASNGKVYTHYDIHNIYGWSESIPTIIGAQQATKTRSIVITRSNFPSTGRYAGHWSGDNTASWKMLRESIISMIEMNLFGIPYTGSDICGFVGTSDEELCLRWHQVGAFYPMSRNHNGKDVEDQHPTAYSQNLVSATKEALNKRYKMLPYYYTLFHQANKYGGTVIRSLAHEFPQEITVRETFDQFMIGSAIMISPSLYPGQTEVAAKFPGTEKWYNFETGQSYATGTHLLPSPLNHINIHMQGGNIIMMQKEKRNTVESRKTPFTILIALNKQNEAFGDFFWDDGISIKTYPIEAKLLFTDSFQYIINKKISIDTIISNSLEKIVIYGYEKYDPKKKFYFTIPDKSSVQLTTDYDSYNQVLTIKMPLSNSGYLNADFHVHAGEFKSKSYIDCLPNQKVPEESLKSLCLSYNCKYRDIGNDFGNNVPRCSISKNTLHYTVAEFHKDNDYFHLSETVFHKNGGIQWEDSGTNFVQEISMSIVTTDYGTFITFSDTHHLNRPKTADFLQIQRPTPDNIDNDLLDVDISSVVGEDFRLKINRRNGITLLDTTSYDSPLAFEDKYLHIAWQLATTNCEGITDNEDMSKLFKETLVTTFFIRENKQDSIPYYICKEPSGDVHGVLFLNGALQEFWSEPPKNFVYKTIGGLMEFIIFPGPSLKDVTNQFNSLFDRKSKVNDHEFQSLQQINSQTEIKPIGIKASQVSIGLQPYLMKNSDFVNLELASLLTTNDLGIKTYYIDYFHIEQNTDYFTGQKNDTKIFVKNYPYIHKNAKQCSQLLHLNIPSYPIHLCSEMRQSQCELSAHTFCMDTIHQAHNEAYYHYNLHNLYPYEQTRKWNRNGFKNIYSESVTPGISFYSGVIIQNNVLHYLRRYSYIGITSFSLNLDKVIWQSLTKYLPLFTHFVPNSNTRRSDFEKFDKYSGHRRAMEVVASQMKLSIFASVQMIKEYDTEKNNNHKCVSWGKCVIVCDTNDDGKLYLSQNERLMDIKTKKMIQSNNVVNIYQNNDDLQYFLTSGSIFVEQNNFNLNVYAVLDEKQFANGHFYLEGKLYDIEYENGQFEWYHFSNYLLPSSSYTISYQKF